ncbi:MAG: hypothetical protein AABY22_16435, partial [Nanoarchaeota archaeon]
IKFDSFTRILSIGGSISGGLTILLILAMIKKAKKLGNRKPEYSLPVSMLVLTLIGIIFTAGIVYEILSVLGVV